MGQNLLTSLLPARPSPLSAPSFQLLLSGQGETGATGPQSQHFHSCGGQASLSTMTSASLTPARAQQVALVKRQLTWAQIPPFASYLIYQTQFPHLQNGDDNPHQSGLEAIKCPQSLAL